MFSKTPHPPAIVNMPVVLLVLPTVARSDPNNGTTVHGASLGFEYVVLLNVVPVQMENPYSYLSGSSPIFSAITPFDKLL